MWSLGSLLRAFCLFVCSRRVRADSSSLWRVVCSFLLSIFVVADVFLFVSDGITVPGMSGALGKDGQRVANGADVPSKEISPLPGFVVKTKDASRDGRKVFINVCQHEDIKNFSKRVQLMEDGTEQEGLSVPCSVGPPRPIKDKAGKPAVVFDVIVNPAVIKEATGDVTGSSRHWLVEIGMDRIDGKYKTALDRRYKLPKARYVGKVATQRIRLTQKPKIEAVVEDDGEDEKAKMNRSKKRKKLKEDFGDAVVYRLEYSHEKIDECDDYADEVYEIDSSDMPELPIHPNCKCYYEDEETGEYLGQDPGSAVFGDIPQIPESFKKEMESIHTNLQSIQDVLKTKIKSESAKEQILTEINKIQTKIESNTEEQERLLKQEKLFTSDKGNLCIFDPAGMHRGGICKSGIRIALQILMK